MESVLSTVGVGLLVILAAAVLVAAWEHLQEALQSAARREALRLAAQFSPDDAPSAHASLGDRTLARMGRGEPPGKPEPSWLETRPMIGGAAQMPKQGSGPREVDVPLG